MSGAAYPPAHPPEVPPIWRPTRPRDRHAPPVPCLLREGPVGPWPSSHARPQQRHHLVPDLHLGQFWVESQQSSTVPVEGSLAQRPRIRSSTTFSSSCLAAAHAHAPAVGSGAGGTAGPWRAETRQQGGQARVICGAARGGRSRTAPSLRRPASWPTSPQPGRYRHRRTTARRCTAPRERMDQ